MHAQLNAGLRQMHQTARLNSLSPYPVFTNDFSGALPRNHSKHYNEHKLGR